MPSAADLDGDSQFFVDFPDEDLDVSVTGLPLVTGDVVTVFVV